MNEEENQWGTLEELLLAYAVIRHGTDSWHSVSAELLRHTSDHRHHFTPPNCCRRYTVLRRRLGGGVGGGRDDLVAELRKLRVQELKRQVEKHDLAIELLEMKLKRLEETDLLENKEPVGSVGGEERSLNESNSTTSEPVVEPEEFEPGDEVPLAAKKIVIKSQPLNKILAIIRAHKNSSVFERRLKSQESERYKKMIRQHVDLQTVQRRLEKGFYLHSQCKFFRDLLLLFTNAIIFFSKTSDEFLAATEFQKLVITQMAKTIPKPDKNKRQIEPYHTKLERAPSPSPPIVVCRRRSSIGSKPGSNFVAVAKSTKEVEVKVKMKNPKFDVKAKERVIVKKPDVKENNITKGINKKTLPVKELESSSSEETDDEEEIGRIRNRKEVNKNGKRGGRRRETGREADSTKLIGKRGRPGKGPVPVATRGRGGNGGKESFGVAEDTGRTKKRPRR